MTGDESDKIYEKLIERLDKQQAIITDLVAIVDLLEAKLNKHQKLLNLLAYRDRGLTVETTDLGGSELLELADLSELLRKEGVELDV